MAWTEIDEGEKLWTLPASRMKAREPHEVPLPPAAMALLEPPAGDDGQKLPRGTYIFSTGRRGDRPISGFNKLKLQLDRHILAARLQGNAKAKPMGGWRLHDIRRSVRSGLARLSVRPDVAERVLAHVPGGIERVYDLHHYGEEKRRALEAWARHVERITNPQNNVVELRR
jgi:integrase